MKQIKKKRILKIAEEAGLVYNTHLKGFKIFPHHADALYEFYLLIEQEQKKYAQEENAKDSGVLHKFEPEST